MNDIGEILISLGYTVQDCGGYLRCNAHYRGATDIGSLIVYKDTGKYFDYPQNVSGNIKELIKSSGINYNIEIKQEEKEKFIKTYDDSLLKDLMPNYSFFKNRGISEQTQKVFEAGFCHNGLLNNRVVFPVRDFDLNIIGFSGRTTRSNFQEKDIPKWKHLGHKNKFVYPWWISDYYISDTVLITEGIGDILALYENNIRNILCLFGLKISQSLIDYLTKKNVKKIIIATNNEDSGRGNFAALEIKDKLAELFDDIEIILPLKKDFGEHNEKDWFNYKLLL